MPSLQKLFAFRVHSAEEEQRKRSAILDHVGFWKLSDTARDYIVKKFRSPPWTLEEHHFKNFIMLVKHVKNNQFKF